MQPNDPEPGSKPTLPVIKDTERKRQIEKTKILVVGTKNRHLNELWGRGLIKSILRNHCTARTNFLSYSTIFLNEEVKELRVGNLIFTGRKKISDMVVFKCWLNVYEIWWPCWNYIPNVTWASPAVYKDWSGELLADCSSAAASLSVVAAAVPSAVAAAGSKLSVAVASAEASSTPPVDSDSPDE